MMNGARNCSKGEPLWRAKIERFCYSPFLIWEIAAKAEWVLVHHSFPKDRMGYSSFIIHHYYSSSAIFSSSHFLAVGFLLVFTFSLNAATACGEATLSEVSFFR